VTSQLPTGLVDHQRVTDPVGLLRLAVKPVSNVRDSTRCHEPVRDVTNRSPVPYQPSPNITRYHRTARDSRVLVQVRGWS
jgi:hypothetical protein